MDSLFAAWVIGPYLVLQTISLAFLAVVTWLCSDWAALSSWLLVECRPLARLSQGFRRQSFVPYQREVLAACSAGLGGAVFMIREFYLNFAYGKKRLSQPRRFLQASEIPRYILLPFSSFVLGPVGLALLQAGAIIFSGWSSDRLVPLFTIVAVCFLLGFGYHDTLNALRDRSKETLEFRASPRTQKE